MLAQWQQAFLEYVSQPSNQGSKSSDACHELCAAQRNLPARLAVYRNNYRQGIIKYLQTVFPQIVMLLGERCFHSLGQAFCEQYVLTGAHSSANVSSANVSSESGNQKNKDSDPWMALAKLYTGFLKTMSQQHATLQDLPFLADVASIDWLLYKSYYAQNLPFDICAFSALSQAQQLQVHFILSDTVGCFASSWPLLSIWQLNYENRDLPCIEQSEQAVPYWVYREGDKPVLTKLTASEYKFYQAVQQGHPLSVLAAIDEMMIADWISRQWIHRFAVNAF